MSLTLSQLGHRLLVAGELDMATAAELETYVRIALKAEPAALTLDLTDVTFIDSFGVRGLVLAARRASSADVAFTVLCPYANQQVRRVLGILQLSSMMAIVAVEPDLPTTSEQGRLAGNGGGGREIPEDQPWVPGHSSTGPPRRPQSAEGLMRAYKEIEQHEREEDPEGRW